MTNIRVFITGIGIISPLGNGFKENRSRILSGISGIKPLSLFPVPNVPLPSGQIDAPVPGDLPRTHGLALIAAKEALAGSGIGPDAIIIGSTTGGMPLTENLIKEKKFDPLTHMHLYKYHSTGSIAEYLARALKCTGPIISVSTACSSGTLAIKLSLELLRSGMARNVLTGGADGLCRLTYHGFNSLQLIDPNGARPFDEKRKGMSVAEGAAMLLLTAAREAPDSAFAEILGAGLSCDAYHPASPHPEGLGAIEAMKAAIRDAGVSPEGIDYINLHGTGTIDNDLSEARAVKSLFVNKMPFVSSIKGATGHSLAAAGAIEAAVSVMSIKEGIIPANTGCLNADPNLGIKPELSVVKAAVNTVLSNSFGFGGNNASVVIGALKKAPEGKMAVFHPLSEPPLSLRDISPFAGGATCAALIVPPAKGESRPSGRKGVATGQGGEVSGFTPAQGRVVFSILGKACATGAGNLKESSVNLDKPGRRGGTVDIEKLSENLPKTRTRRLKRLPRLVLSLAEEAFKDSGSAVKPSSIFFGTGWGALTETCDFLEKLYETGEQFPSPTDFIGSVHNAPAGQAAIWFKAHGPNVTATGGDYSFEQAFLTASLVCKDDEPALLAAADEYHPVLSPVLDESSLYSDREPSDGGGAFIIKRYAGGTDTTISLLFFEYSYNNPGIIKSLIQKCGGTMNKSFAAIFAGMPAARRTTAEKQLEELKAEISPGIPVIDYRKFTGEFASASAAASAIAADAVLCGRLLVSGSGEIDLNGRGILVLGLGDFVSAIGIMKMG